MIEIRIVSPADRPNRLPQRDGAVRSLTAKSLKPSCRASDNLGVLASGRIVGSAPPTREPAAIARYRARQAVQLAVPASGAIGLGIHGTATTVVPVLWSWLAPGCNLLSSGRLVMAGRHRRRRAAAVRVLWPC